MKIPTFGQQVRAARLGYHWYDKIQAMVRVSGNGPFQIQVCPPDQLPSGQGKGKGKHKEVQESWAWWEEANSAGGCVLDICPAIHAIKKVTQPIQITVDEDGRQI